MKEFITTIKLPDLKQFKSKSKHECPYVKFWKFVGDKLDLGLKQINVSGGYVSKKVDDTLLRYTKEWAKTCHKLNGKMLETSVGFHHLDVSPAVLDEDDYLKDDQVYITVDIEKV